jgi:RNA polymerase-binding transcription factor DksA
MKAVLAERFRPILEAKLAEIDRFLTRQELPEPPADPGDAIDQSQNAAATDLAFQSVDLESGIYREVQSALDRVREGVFGLCVDCDEPIDEHRLEAVPWTPRCRTCQERLEKQAEA